MHIGNIFTTHLSQSWFLVDDENLKCIERYFVFSFFFRFCFLYFLDVAVLHKTFNASVALLEWNTYNIFQRAKTLVRRCCYVNLVKCKTIDFNNLQFNYAGEQQRQ